MEADSLKRLLVTVISFVALLLSQKFGIQLSDTTIASLAGIISIFLAQSGWVTAAKAKAAGVAAAAGVGNEEQAAAVLGGVK